MTLVANIHTKLSLILADSLVLIFMQLNLLTNDAGAESITIKSFSTLSGFAGNFVWDSPLTSSDSGLDVQHFTYTCTNGPATKDLHIVVITISNGDAIILYGVYN